MTWATDRLDALTIGAVTLPPVVATLQLGAVDDWSPGRAKKRWKSSPELLQADGTMFGGYIAALADQMSAFAAMSVLPDGMTFRTANLSVQFLKLARGCDLSIEAQVLAQSRQVIAVETEFRDPTGELLAKAHAQQIVTALK